MEIKLRIGPYVKDFNKDIAGTDKRSFGRKWKLGSCHGSQEYEYGRALFVERCCIPAGNYTLICQNKKANSGWGDASIEIQGQKYCDDFIGWEAMQEITVLCKYAF